MRTLWKVMASVLLVAASPVSAAGQCTLEKILELPVQIAGRRAIVTTKINGHEARFILDSGAVFSNLSRASAAEFGLKTTDAPSWLHLQGITGETAAEMTTVPVFELGGVTLPRIQFLVAGTDTGTAGLLGQNFLGLFDIEYDFPHSMVRLLRTKNCPDVSAAYWSGDRPVTMVRLQLRKPPMQKHTMGVVTLNNTRLLALFDSGSETAMLTTAAARRAGMTRDSADVTPAGFSSGLGSRTVQSWMARFDRIDIGGEAIPNPHIRFGDVTFGSADMLIGFDFFLTHRILVENEAARMLVTYEGGPLFGLTPRGVRSSDGKPIQAVAPDAAPTDAEGFARHGAVAVSGGKLAAGIADFDSAIALAPQDTRYLKLRASARVANHQHNLAMDDYEKAIAIDPNDPDTRQGRAALKLGSHDRDGALPDLKAMDRLLPPSAAKRLLLAGMFDAADDYADGLINFDLWLKFHAIDANRPEALNGSCWARALLDRELDRALADCNAAIRARPKDAAYFDSRALVRLRQSDWMKAKADYDTALATNPHNALGFYGRSIARAKLGDAAGADADRAAALAIQPKVAERAKRLGLEGGGA